MAISPINPTQLTPPRVEFIDPRSGAISREWYRFFLSLLTATENTQSEVNLAPDTASLIATYDAMLDALAQATEVQPEGATASEVAVVQTDIQALASTPLGASVSELAVVQSEVQALESAPLGASVADLAVVQSEVQALESAPASASASDLAVVQSELQELALSPAPRSGVAPPSEGGTGTSTQFTAGSVVFAGASGVYTQDNANLFWDNTANDLGIGTIPSGAKLDVAGLIRSRTGAATLDVNHDGVNGSVQSSSDLLLYANGASSLVSHTNSIERMRITSSGNVGVGTGSPNASAILDVQSTTKGFRLPNMTTTQKNAISSPAAGLMVFDTTLAKACVYSGTAWQTITST